jgi:hypothetical protein
VRSTDDVVVRNGKKVRRRRVVIEDSCVSPAVVDAMIAAVVCKLGSLAESPVNKLVVETTARKLMNDAGFQQSQVMLNLPRVVHCYFHTTNYRRGTGSGWSRTKYNWWKQKIFGMILDDASAGNQ